MNSAKEPLVGGGTIHEAGGLELLVECRELKGCETDECKVTLVYKLCANYIFHTIRPRDTNDYKLNNCYESLLPKVLTYNVKLIVFCCVATGIPEFDQKKAVKMALATVIL